MRIVAVADSDSYVKWAAAMLGRMPSDWQVSLVIVRSPKEPSRSQLLAALAGTAIGLDAVTTLPFGPAVAHVASERADVVLVATIGPLADLVTEAVLEQSDTAPVIVSGVPGIALPARRKALIYRSQARLIVLHSVREIRVFERIAAGNQLPQQFALATLPFLTERHLGSDPHGHVVFAAQAIVPPTRVQRASLLRSLATFARRYPHLRVIIKVRALVGEGQTHAETIGYAELLQNCVAAPPNLVVESGPMAEHLNGASALVTVSSTAAIEAVALGIPTLIVNDFGVSPELINDVFVGSGLLGSTADLMERQFTEPNEAWLADNYFHDEERNTWIAEIESLVAENRSGGLVPMPRVIRGRGGALRRAWDRKRALGAADRSLSGLAALAIGTPMRIAVLAMHSLARLLVHSPLPLNDEAAELAEGRRAAEHSR